MKQQLGFEDYTGMTLQSLERYIDLILLTFLYLEVERARIISDPSTSEGARRKATSARTLGMQEFIRAEANQQLFKEVKQSVKSQRPNPSVMAFLEAMVKPNDTRAKSRRL